MVIPPYSLNEPSTFEKHFQKGLHPWVGQQSPFVNRMSWHRDLTFSSLKWSSKQVIETSHVEKKIPQKSVEEHVRYWPVIVGAVGPGFFHGHQPPKPPRSIGMKRLKKSFKNLVVSGYSRGSYLGQLQQPHKTPPHSVKYIQFNGHCSKWPHFSLVKYD